MKGLVLLAIFIMISNSAFAASFDCGKARTEVEKLVCSDHTTSDLDSRIGSAYTDALRGASHEDQAALIASQKNWIKNVRNKCTDAECLREVYAKRLDGLTRLKTDAATTRSVTGSGQQTNVCQGIREEIETKGVEGFNKHYAERRLGELCGYKETPCSYVNTPIPLKELDRRGVDLKKLALEWVAEDPEFTVFVSEIDVNNDGLPDIWLYRVVGSAHCQRNFFLIQDRKSHYTHLDSLDDGLWLDETAYCQERELVARRINGLTYFVYASEVETIVFLVQPSNKVSQVCQFKPKMKRTRAPR